MQKTITTSGYEETQKFGEEFAKNLKGGDVVLLYGELGAGKTTFVQGLAKGLGITKRIISPTFVIVRSYKTGVQYAVYSILRFYHIDLYRTESLDDLKNIGLEEILKDKNAIVAIEWPEKLGKLLPQKRIEIKFNHVGENKREITVEKYE